MIFEVKLPVLGFEQVKSMKLEKIDEVFVRLSNAEDNSPVFTLINPYAIRKYDFEIPAAVRLLLDLENSKNIFIANIMVIQSPIQKSTINFSAPVIFNFDNQMMAQVVLDSQKYPHFSLSDPVSLYYQDDEIKTPQ